MTSGSRAVFSAEQRRLDLAGQPVLTGIKRISGLSGSNLYGILSDFSGNCGRILIYLGSDLLEGHSLLHSGVSAALSVLHR